MIQDNIPLEVIFESEDLIAINKPHGLLVHRTKIARDANVFALQLLRDQTGMKLYPVHRLDRKTSGVLLFAKSVEVHKQVRQLFETRKVQKTYLAILRGFAPSKGIINYSLTHENKIQEAITHYECLEYFEIPVSSGKYPTSRYSLVKLCPETGRFHQLRKHMAHILHPIIGDRPHGCNKQNRFWKERFNMTYMLLHASQLSFQSLNNSYIFISAFPSSQFVRVLTILRDANILNHTMR